MRKQATMHRQLEPAGDNTPGIALLKQAQGFADTFNRAIATHQTVQFILVKGHAWNQEQRQSRIDAQRAPLAAMLQALSGRVNAQDGSVDTPGEKIPHMHEPLVVVTAQAGMGVTAAEGWHVAAGEVAHVGSGRDLHVAVGDTFTMHSGQGRYRDAGATRPNSIGGEKHDGAHRRRRGHDHCRRQYHIRMPGHDIDEEGEQAF